MKKLIVLTILPLLFLTTSPLSANADSIPDEQWNLPMNAPDQDQAELIGLKIAGAASGLDSPAYLFGNINDTNNKEDDLLCSSLQDSNCSSAKRIGYQSYLPPCSDIEKVNCISGITAISSDGKETTGTYQKYFPVKTENDYVGDSNRNLPNGTEPSVWTIPGVTNGGGSDSYLIRFQVDGSSRNGEKFNADTFRVSLFPITTKTGPYTLGKMTDKNHPSDACKNDHFQCGRLGSQHGGNDVTLSAACVSFDIGFCALRQAFPAGYRFRISANLGNSPTGWFHGRFYNPEISLSTNGNVTNLSVTADPVIVPAVGTYIKQSAMPSDMKAFYQKIPPGGAFGRLSANGISNLISAPEPSAPRVFDEYAIWNDLFKNQASASQSEWSFRTLQLGPGDGACINDNSKLVGVVSTNAMMYSGGAPAFNRSEGSLDYKVGSPHLDSKGQVFKGTYDLQLRSDVARCLYKFSSAPIKATISISSDNGDSNIATTVVSEDKNTGWLHMSAANFTFSNPIVKVKITQDGAKPLPVIKNITCIKGKTTKVVTTSTCPAGFKKK